VVVTDLKNHGQISEALIVFKIPDHPTARQLLTD